MTSSGKATCWNRFFLVATLTGAFAAGPAFATSGPAIYEGKAVSIGEGTARTVVHTDGDGKLLSIAVNFTPGMLAGLPAATQGEESDFRYFLPMPATGPKTVFDHVLIDWEALGHPPPHVYDVPHFDFHFYLIGRSEQDKISFRGPNDSADPEQQPAADLLPPGYAIPPGTAVPRMGVHAIDPAAPEFHDQPFTATFIYGYFDKQQIFVEPMVSLAFLKSKPSFSAPVVRPRSYGKPGLYPSVYGVKYDSAHDLYEVTLADFK